MNRKVITGFLLILIFVFAAAGYAQQVDPSIPLKIAHQYRNDYEFEDALEWYEKVINDFPNTQAAAEAILNRIVILDSQAATYSSLCLDFSCLALAKIEEASNYISDELKFEALSESNKLKGKEDSYKVKLAQTGKKLREEFYRFEKDYARFIEKLPIPWIPLKDEDFKDTPIISVKEDDAIRILTLGLVPSLEFKSRIEFFIRTNFRVSCFLIALGEGFSEPNKRRQMYEQWSSGEYTGGINQVGFYFCLGVGLLNYYQHKTALCAFDKVLALTADASYDKLRYESEKKKKECISSWKVYFALLPAEAQEFAEKLEE